MKKRGRKEWVWYQTDLGFHATEGRLLRHPKKIILLWRREGKRSFLLSDFKDVTFTVTTRGKLQITYFPETTNREECLKRVKPWLLRANGAPAQEFSVIAESALAETLSVAEVWLLRGQELMTGDRSLVFDLTVRNKSQASTTVERVQIEAAGKQVVDRNLEKEHVPGGATVKISVPCLASWLGDVWKMGGQLDLRVVHTHDVELLSFEVPSLREKNLPFHLFPPE